jgi:hypothetical protein
MNEGFGEGDAKGNRLLIGEKGKGVGGVFPALTIRNKGT